MKRSLKFYLDYIETIIGSNNTTKYGRRYIEEVLINVRSVYLKNTLNKSRMLEGFKTIMNFELKFQSTKSTMTIYTVEVPELIKNKFNDGIIRAYVDQDLYKPISIVKYDTLRFYGGERSGFRSITMMAYEPSQNRFVLKSSDADILMKDSITVESYITNPYDYYRSVGITDENEIPADIDTEHFAYMIPIILKTLDVQHLLINPIQNIPDNTGESVQGNQAV